MNCDNCASLCCIAPSIVTGGENQGRGTIEIVKKSNVRCAYLIENGKCGIHSSRFGVYNQCVQYDCRGFGPILTEHLRKGGHIQEDATLDEYGVKIFTVLNGMQVLSRWGVDDLFEAMSVYEKTKAWPEWMLTDEYYDYLFGSGVVRRNPRHTQKDDGKGISYRQRIIRIVSGFF